jgi:glycosyltransferase involved in cell wall biosynthesis
LVQSGDVDALAEGMNDMYNNYEMYNRNNIRKICIRKFAPEVIAQQLTSIFDEVVSK